MYFIFNKMVYSVLPQLQYLATCFGFYKIIFGPMITIGKYIQCVHTIKVTQRKCKYQNIKYAYSEAIHLYYVRVHLLELELIQDWLCITYTCVTNYYCRFKASIHNYKIYFGFNYM